MPVGHAKFDMNRCNESPLQGEKPDFWPVSKFNTGSLSLRSILPAIMYYNAVIVLTPLLCFCIQQCIVKPVPNNCLFYVFEIQAIT